VNVFDAFFVVSFLATITALIVAVWSVARGRKRKALRILAWLGVCVAAYLVAVTGVSVATPRRVLDVGEDRCWDDWCLGVSRVERVPLKSGTRYQVTIRVSSRAGRRAQRGLGAYVCVVDDQGHRYDPLPDPAARRLDGLLQPLETLLVTRTFDLPPNASSPALMLSHGGGFPGCLIIGDDASLFHKGTAVKLD
jgi:hypothetical protein